MGIEIREITPDEADAFGRALGSVFGFSLKEERQEWWRRTLARCRALAAFDDGEVVATCGTYPLQVTVPGASRVGTGGTTMISVRPTHRRRGLLRRLMEAHLDDVAEHEEPLAALWASESGIYSRFGYGMAAYQARLKIERHRAVLVTPVDVPGTIRTFGTDDALPALMAVYDRASLERPGMLARSEEWWRDELLADFEEWRDGRTELHVAVYAEAGVPEGYVIYRLKTDWGDAGPQGTVHLWELMASSEAVTLALWQYVFGIDLMAHIDAWNRPVDDTLRWHLEEPRRLTAQVSDSLWVRLMDVPGALEARAYRTSGNLVLEVRDEFRPGDGGRFSLEAGPDGAACARTDAPPDLVVGASELGALYLGGNSARQLARAGRIEGDDAAVATADDLFGWSPAPWCPEVF